MASKYHHPSNLDEESEETVSLCDLPIDGYESNYTTKTSEDSMKDEESFEFFTQEWLEKNQDLSFFSNKGIIFGGNLIVPKIPTSRNTQEFKKHDQHGSTKVEIFKGRNHGGKHASMKSRWYYYGFGLAGIRTEMELSDIRSRQNGYRKSRLVGGRGGGGKEESGGFRQGKGLGRLIGDLICDGQTQPNSMVKASLVYIPRV
ncbi:hypothetical protein SSX86_032698 [Deinandra increscens subsp. villosa]|uniref:Uncharacterized protein n=1 Tax=Deinandra increscens subsp. villosa TaxID=3103831 RepID=A0AAP0C757_9ASTR